MQIGSPEWQSIIADGAAAHGVLLSSAQIAGFTVHAQTLLEWNRRINLTRIVEPEAVAIRHFVDALTPLPYLEGVRTIMDIGSGGGFPGLVLATMMPESQVVMVDSVRKKISFLQHLIRMRGLINADAIHARAEDLHTTARYRRGFDALVSRACGDLPVTLQAAAPLAGDDACIIAMRGPLGAEECDRFMAGIDRRVVEETLGFAIAAQVVEFHLPRDHGRRHLLIFKRAPGGGAISKAAGTVAP